VNPYYGFNFTLTVAEILELDYTVIILIFRIRLAMKEQNKTILMTRRNIISHVPQIIRAPNCYNLFTADFYKAYGM